MSDNIGKYIRKIRKERGMIQQDLADAIYCSQQHIGYVEQGQRTLDNNYLLPLSNALKFNFIQLMKEKHKYQKTEHYILAHRLIDLLQQAEYEDVSALLQDEVIKNEFNYGSTYIIKEYCHALVLVNLNNDNAKAEKILLNILKIDSREEIKNFIPTYNAEERYYSCTALLSHVLCNLNQNELSMILLENTIQFLEKEFFNDTIPNSSIDSYFKKLYIILLNNYADDLLSYQRYEEALNVCNKAIEKVSIFGDICALELVLKLKVEALYKLNRIDESQEAYTEFYVVCKIMNCSSYLESTNNIIKDKYSLLEVKSF